MPSMATSVHVRIEVPESEIPIDFMKRGLSYLEAAETLNTLMCENAWPSNYYRGQAVLWLTFHAVELLLKGCILKLKPRARVGGHSLADLTATLKKLAPGIDFEAPFGAEALPPYPEFVEIAKRSEKKLHEVFRYPVNSEGKPWPGVHGFSAPLFQSTLADIREKCEKLYDRVFENKDR